MERFTKRQRLRRRAEFVSVQRQGLPVHTRHFVLLAVAGSGRMGLTVTKKVGNAVTRNRIKRLVREVSRRRRWVPENRDVVVVAKRRAADICFRTGGFAVIAKELCSAGPRLR